MIEQAFLDAIGAYLSASGRLAPVPKLVGFVDPAAAGELPAVVLSLAAMERFGSGLGERSVLMIGALRWTARIDLANPVLPEEPTFRLLSPDRKTLNLPHGGLVRADGDSGAASPQDIQVRVDGAARVLVAAAPGVNEFQADLLNGTLIFGAALPPAGIVEATYFIGQWERRTGRLRGQLLATILADDVAAARDLSASLTSAMGRASQTIPGLSEISVTDLGSVALGVEGEVATRRRSIRFRFEYELEIDIPDSSGGVIRQVPIHERLA